jgi:hypothetical protein
LVVLAVGRHVADPAAAEAGGPRHSLTAHLVLCCRRPIRRSGRPGGR